MPEDAGSMNNLAGWILAAVGLVALAGSGWWLMQPEEPAAEETGGHGFVLPVTVATLERGDLQPRALLSGTVRAARRSSLGFDAQGLLSSLVVVEGERVKAGGVLAELNHGDEDLELEAANAALNLVQKELALLQAGEREEEKRRLKAVLEATEAEAELARLEVERGNKLIDDRIISQSELDKRAAEHQAADKRRIAAQEEYGRALAGTRAEDLAIAEARVAETLTRVRTAEYKLEKTTLTAPWPGTVIQRFVSVGDYVSAGDPVFEVVDLENLELHIEVPGRFAPRMGSNSRVLITLPGQSDFSIEKALDTTIPAADETARSFRAIVRTGPNDDPDDRLKPGMFVELELRLEPVKGALVLPSDCVLASEEGTYLVRAKPETGPEGRPGLVADFVPVRVLAQADTRSAIVSLGPPLEAGDSIVLVGADNAFPGAALMPRGAGGASGPPSGTADEDEAREVAHE
jgi:HlyD family secretion protein